MSSLPKTALAAAMWRGFRQKCPHCGTGALFGKFLKVKDQCQDCQEELHHHRADDLPAYLVITIVCNLVVPPMLAWEMIAAPPIWLQCAVWLPLTLFGCLGLLQPVKGAIVGLQWHLGMHGFSRDRPASDTAASSQTS